MSSYECAGRIIKIGETEHKSEKFKVREFVIETEGKYPQSIAFQLANDRTVLIDDYSEGDTITVSFNLRGREWQGRYFTNLDAWRISGEGYSQSAKPQQKAAASQTNFEEDIPF